MYPPAQQQTRAAYLCAQFELTYDTTADLVDILTVDRSEISWIRANYRNIMSRSICGKCRTTTGPFELDHMSPWRPYVIAFLGPDEITQSDEELLVSKTIVRALYNDPENLWCLCQTCNREKSDQVYSIGQAIDIRTGLNPEGEKVRVRDKRELAALWE